MQALNGFAARLARIWLLRGSLDGLTLGGLVVGLVALLAAFLLAPLPPLIAAAGLTLALVIGAGLSWQHRPTQEQAAALFEEGRPSGGLVLSAATEDPRWHDRALQLAAPRARFRFGPRLGRTALALAFALAAIQLELDRPLLVDPAGGLQPSVENAAETARALDELADEMDIELTDLNPAIEAIEELNPSGELELVLEALDRLDDLLEAKRRELGAELGRRDASLGAAAALAEAAAQLDDPGAQLSRQIAEALAELSEAGLGSELSPEIAAAMQAAREALAGGDSKISRETLRELAEKLGEARKQALDQAARACDSPGSGSPASPGAIDALRAALAEASADDQAAEDAVLKCLAGVGVGVNRGPGHVELEIGDAVDDDGSGFLDHLLPDRRDFRDSQVIGLSAGEADGEAGAYSAGGALGHAGSSQAGLEEAVLPRHRRAVRDYFAAPPE